LTMSKQLVDSLEANKKELNDLVEALEGKLKQSGNSELHSNKTAQVDAQTFYTLLEERRTLTEQIKDLEYKLSEQHEKFNKSSELLKEDARKELEAINEQNEKFMEELSEGYKRRIKGLTDALTACLNDNDVIEELKKERKDL